MCPPKRPRSMKTPYVCPVSPATDLRVLVMAMAIVMVIEVLLCVRSMVVRCVSSRLAVVCTNPWTAHIALLLGPAAALIMLVTVVTVWSKARFLDKTSLLTPRALLPLLPLLGPLMMLLVVAMSEPLTRPPSGALSKVLLMALFRTLFRALPKETLSWGPLLKAPFSLKCINRSCTT